MTNKIHIQSRTTYDEPPKKYYKIIQCAGPSDFWFHWNGIHTSIQSARKKILKAGADVFASYVAEKLKGNTL